MLASSESLPLSGFGSESWFRKTFNFDIERKKVISVIEAGINPVAAITWLKHEVTTFLTEWGVGREALTLQPATSYEITIIDGKPNIFAHSLNEFGEQLEGYLNFEDMPESIGFGLQRAFMQLSDLNPGEGVVILSPTELYQDYNSPGDVINPLVVTQVDHDSDGNPTKITANGWFIFINRKLSLDEKCYWFQLHPDSPSPSNLNDPKSIAQQPQSWESSTNLSLDDEDGPVRDYMSTINKQFIEKFGRPLFPSKKETGLKESIKKNVDREINSLKELLIGKEKQGFLNKLWSLMQNGQKTWAELMDINFDWYWSQILTGQIQILGFHPAGDTDDIFSNDGLESIFDKPEHYCKKHGSYHGESCPKCSK